MRQSKDWQPSMGPKIMLRICTIGLLGVLCFNIACIVTSMVSPVVAQSEDVSVPTGLPSNNPTELAPPRVRKQWMKLSQPAGLPKETIVDSIEVDSVQSNTIRQVTHWGAPNTGNSTVTGLSGLPPLPVTYQPPMSQASGLANFGLPPLPFKVPSANASASASALQQSSTGFATGASFGPPPRVDPSQFLEPLPSLNQALSVPVLPGMNRASAVSGLAPGARPVAATPALPTLPDLGNLRMDWTPPNIQSLHEISPPLNAANSMPIDLLGEPQPACFPLRWIKAEFLGWFVGDDSLPPLLTTAPAGAPSHSAGQLGQPDTRVLFGDMGRFTPGARWTAGYIPNTCLPCWQPEFEFFGLGSRGNRTYDGADGTLARPFYNTDPAVNGPDTQIINMAGLANGSIAFGYGSQVLSAAPRLRKPLWNCREPVCDSCDPCRLDTGCSTCQSCQPCGVNCGDLCGCPPSCNACRQCEFSGMNYTQVDFLLGYRYMRLSERLSALERLEPTSSTFAPGTAFELSDQIQTRNDFHGGEFGFSWLKGRECWSAEATGLLALGHIYSRYQMDGQTNGYIGSTLLSSNSGGFLVRPENVGSYNRSRFGFMPQLRLKLRYQWNECIHSHVGYDLLYLRSVVRPGSLASTRFNGSTLGAAPGPLTNVDPRPNSDDVWFHGFNLGLSITW